MPPTTSARAPRPRGGDPGRRIRLAVIMVALVLVAGIGCGAYWGVSTVRASFPQITGTLKLPDLSGRVEVDRDGQGIPQVYADSAADLFRAQGYIQAQDRFYQMDISRHFTAGTLSEMFGASQVDSDAFLRTLGLRRVAQQEWDSRLSASTKSVLQAYSDGVNAYLQTHHGAAISVEYSSLGLGGDYTPQAWTPVDSLSWLKSLAWTERSNMQDELDRALMAGRLTPGQITQLYPPYPYSRTQPIVSGGTVSADGKSYMPSSGSASTSVSPTAAQPASGLNSASSQLAAVAKTINGVPGLLGPAGSGVGSNAWVISGKYTTTGKPLLANDPHFGPQMPSIWYQMGLHCRTVSASCPYDVSGFTAPGMPGVFIGHNQSISWGMTEMGADTSDLYLEKVTGGTYLYDGKQLPLAARQETINVAGGRPRTITVRTTNNGPLISDVSDEYTKVGQEAPVSDPAPDRAAGYAIALRWTALTPGKTMDAVLEFDRAADFTQFRDAARDFAVPSQNLIYADTSGNIGYQAPGQIPLRGKGDGDYPAPGWDSAYRWNGTIPFSALPWEYNPKQGYIVSANQAVTDKRYPYLLTSDWGYGARSQRITALIRSKTANGGKISMDDMQSMQADDSSEIAQLLVPYLLKIHVTDSYVRQAQQLLQGWDFTQGDDSAPAAYFNAVWRNLLELAFGNKLPKELRPLGQCLRVQPVNNTGPVDNLNGGPNLVTECGQADPTGAQPDGSDRWFEVVRNILPDTNSPWWNTSTLPRSKPTNRDQLLLKALTDARYELTAKLGKDINTWTWGRLHQLELRNSALGDTGSSLTKVLLNRGPWQMSGGEAAIDATGWNAAAGYDVVWAPSFRMVVNLDDLDKSRWINLTGASGHAYSAHYSDQTSTWATGQMLPWAYSQDSVLRAAKDKLTLTP